MYRELTDHKTNDANEKLRVVVLDPEGAGGANHLYVIAGFDSITNPCSRADPNYGKPTVECEILFQNGPIKEVGVNGVTHEALLAILIDRMRSFQRGPYACNENSIALTSLEQALGALQYRTTRRVHEGREGTHALDVKNEATQD